MADVRDVLGMGAVQRGGGGAAPASSASAAAASASAALPRELALLQSEAGWGGSLPLAPTIAPAAFFKAKRVKAVSWKLLPIRSSARTALTGKVVDDVELKHWVKIHNVPDYRFARFNKSIKLLEYSDEEYEAYLNDPKWSRQETDRLLALAKQLDLRFIVMEDRYNAPATAADHARVMGQLPQVDSEAIRAALHAPEAKQAEEQAAAADSVAIASNITLSTHPNPVTAAPSALHAEPAASAAAAAAAADAASSGPTQMDTSADDVPAAAASAAAPVAAAAAATPAAATAAPPADNATSSAVAAATAAADASSVPPITPGTLPPAPLAPALVSSSEPLPAIPASALSSPTAGGSAPSTLVPSCLGGPFGPVLKHRTVEQLKARYYFIQQTLASVRNSSDPDLRKTNPLFTHPYDAIHEMLRKAQLERLYQRTQSEVDAMAETVLEHRKISAQIKKIKKTQKEDRDVLRGYKSGSVKASRSDRAAAAAGGSSKHSKSSSHKRGGGAAVSSSMLAGGAPLPQLVGEMAPLPPSCDAALTVLPHRPSGVYLRSAQLAGSLQLSSKQSKFLDSELASLNIRRARDCTVATGVVCDLWDRLRVNILTLANLQQHVREREVMRDDLRVHSSVAGGAAGAAAAAGGAAGGSALYSANLVQAAAMAAQRKKTEKRKMEGDAEQEDKRARKK